MATNINYLTTSVKNRKYNSLKKNYKSYEPELYTPSYSTVIPSGTHGLDLFDADEYSATQTQTSSNGNRTTSADRTRLSTEERLASVKQRSNERRLESEARHKEQVAKYNAGKRPSSALYSTQFNGATKTEKYRQLSTLMSNLMSEKQNDAKRDARNAGIAGGVIGGIGDVVSYFNAGIGGVIKLFGAIVSGSLASSADKKSDKAETYASMATNINNYLTNLTQRDTTIMNTMDQIYSSMDSMRGAYGKNFVDMMYNYYLGQSGMNPESYSLLTGNFETFEGVGYGRVSKENGLFDTLTDGNQSMFNNLYATISAEDIFGTDFMNQLVNSLYGSNTEFGIGLRNYETELRDALRQSLLGYGDRLSEFGASMEQGNANARAENISYAESIGEAQADTASRGARGGTTYANVQLAQLSRDLAQIERAAGVAAAIGNLKYNLQNQRLNASATAYNYRIAQERAITGAITEAASGFNSIGRTSRQGERTANYYLGEAQSEERQFIDKYEGLGNSDANRMFEVIYG